jgi:hypothetical protein
MRNVFVRPISQALPEQNNPERVNMYSLLTDYCLKSNCLFDV